MEKKSDLSKKSDLAEIIRNLYIGDHKAALQPGVADFDTVLNVTHEVPDHQRYFQLDLSRDETEGANIAAILEASRSIITAAMDRGDRVLVHSNGGKQRSAAIVAHFLTTHLGICSEEAVAMVSNLHPRIMNTLSQTSKRHVFLVITYPCKQHGVYGMPLACFDDMEQAKAFARDHIHGPAVEIRKIEHVRGPYFE